MKKKRRRRGRKAGKKRATYAEDVKVKRKEYRELPGIASIRSERKKIRRLRSVLRDAHLVVATETRADVLPHTTTGWRGLTLPATARKAMSAACINKSSSLYQDVLCNFKRLKYITAQ